MSSRSKRIASLGKAKHDSSDRRLKNVASLVSQNDSTVTPPASIPDSPCPSISESFYEELGPIIFYKKPCARVLLPSKDVDLPSKDVEPSTVSAASTPYKQVSPIQRVMSPVKLPAVALSSAVRENQLSVLKADTRKINRPPVPSPVTPNCPFRLVTYSSSEKESPEQLYTPTTTTAVKSKSGPCRQLFDNNNGDDDNGDEMQFLSNDKPRSSYLSSPTAGVSNGLIRTAKDSAGTSPLADDWDGQVKSSVCSKGGLSNTCHNVDHGFLDLISPKGAKKNMEPRALFDESEDRVLSSMSNDSGIFSDATQSDQSSSIFLDTSSAEIATVDTVRSTQEEAPVILDYEVLPDGSLNAVNVVEVETEQDQDGNINPQNEAINELAGEEEDNEDAETQKPTRKKKVDVYKWKKNIAKTRLARGEEHVSMAGKLIAKRSVKPACDLACRRLCSSKITEEERQVIFDKFWSREIQDEEGNKTRAVTSKEIKWYFLAKSVTNMEKKTGAAAGSKRNFSRQYHFRVNNANVKVCKTMFLNTLDICDAWVTTALKKQGADGDISPDKRGKSTNSRQRVIPDTTKKSVLDHLNSLARQESHYCRADSQKDYITEEIKNVTKAYDEYKKWVVSNCPKELKIATERQYRDIMDYETNISFFQSKKDRCDQCVRWENSSPDDQETTKEDYQLHLANKDLAQEMRKADIEKSRQKDTTLCVANFDYEKVLTCPRGDASIFYYKRKLSVANFTIADCGTHENYCYVYDETVAKKGPNEVASFLKHFIEKRVQEGIQSFIFWSDNCSGQNKNHFVPAVFLYASAKYDVDIIHRFLETGHSYNACDTVHSLIERATKPYKIFTPMQWYEKIRTAKKSKSRPLQVIEVEQSSIIDIKMLAGKLQLEKDTTGKRVPWSKYREMSVKGETNHEAIFRISLAKDESFVVSTKKVGHPVNFATYDFKRAYQGVLPITLAKKKDLLDMCKSKAVPPEFHDFFLQLPAGAVEVEEEDSIVEDDPELQPPAPKKRKMAKSSKSKKS